MRALNWIFACVTLVVVACVIPPTSLPAILIFLFVAFIVIPR